MFTGIIESIGVIERIERRGGDLRLHVDAGALGLDDVKLGDSISVSGVCLTAVEIDGDQTERFGRSQRVQDVGRGPPLDQPQLTAAVERGLSCAVGSRSDDDERRGHAVCEVVEDGASAARSASATG